MTPFLVYLEYIEVRSKSQQQVLVLGAKAVIVFLKGPFYVRFSLLILVISYVTLQVEGIF